MDSTAQTMVISGVSHRYLIPTILIVLFGTIILYNVYSLFLLKRQAKLLSKAEEMILEGHKKLVDNREELFVEGGGVLDGNFIIDEIAENDRQLANLDPEEVAKRERKAAERKRKRDEMNEKARIREEKKKIRLEMLEARKMTPEKQRKQIAKEILVYEATYNVLLEAVTREIQEANDIIAKANKKNEKRYAYVNGKHKNPELQRRRKDELKGREKARKAKLAKKAARAAKKTEAQADINVFAGDDI